MNNYNIWMQGYMIQGMDSPAPASYYGNMDGEDFTDACRKLAEKKGDSNLYSPNSIWGCRLFDNEADARKVFG